MTALESIGIARSKISEAKNLLLQPSAGSLDSCRTCLGDVAQILQELVIAQSGKDGPAGLTPDVIHSIRQIQLSARDLESQIQHGSRFCTGWLQMRLGMGYSDRGAPVMIETEGRSFEL